MSSQNVTDHPINIGQLDTSVYEEVQYEAQTRRSANRQNGRDTQKIQSHSRPSSLWYETVTHAVNGKKVARHARIRL